MADRTIMLRIGADITGLQSQMRAASAAVGDFSKKSASYIDRNSASITDLSNTVGVVGVSLVSLAATAVTRFAQFDKAMSGVAATGDDARGSIDALRQAAVQAGADTAFSAAEAANGIEQLAKAGVSSADILGGGLSGALNLAAAGEIEVGEAAEIAASAMTQFNLEGSDVGHVADLMAAGAGKAQGGVLDMGQALNQAGLIAGQVGLSIEETTGSLAAMASAGLVGSDAGTSLKTSLIALSSPSVTARKEMDRLGISAYDAQGNFIGMEALAGQLQDRLGGLTDEQRNSALATIFGSDALRTANVLYSEGAAGIAKWTDAVDDQGYAAETAAELTDNLIGDIERLGGSLDAVFIQGGSGANDSLRLLVQSAEGVVDAIGRIPAPVLTATTLIAGGGGLALLGVAGMGKLTVATRDTITAYRDLVPAGSRADGAVRRLGRGAAITAGALGAVVLAAQAIESTAPNVSLGVEEMRSRLKALAEDGAGAGQVFEDLNSTWVNFEGFSADSAVVKDAEAFQELLRQTVDPGFLGAAQNQLGSLLGLFGSSDIGQFQSRLAGVNTELSNMVGGGNLAGATDAFASLTEAYQLTDEQAGQLLTSMPEFRDALIGQADASGLATDDATLLSIALGELVPSQEAATAATGASTGALGDNTAALDENWAAQMKASGAVLSLRDAENQAEAAYDAATDSLRENGRTLDVTTEKGRANRSALDAIAESGFDVVDSIRATGGSLRDVQGAMSTARERFIATATSMGMGERAAQRLADQLGLIPSSVSTTANVNTGNAIAKINGLWNTLNRIDGRVVTASVAIKQYGQAAMAEGGSAELAGRLTGQVTGGTPGRDSVNAILMPGEHVLTTSDVRAMGGQGAVYAFRNALHNGPVAPPYVPRFAGGGAAPGSRTVTNTSSSSLTVNNYGEPVTAATLLRYDRQRELLGVGQ